MTIEGKIVALTQAFSSSIAQNGIIADSSGAIRFVSWARANAPAMEYGHWYRIESAVVDEYRVHQT
ncbi:MAG: SOSS complex subunit B family protein [Methanoculleus sp.]